MGHIIWLASYPKSGNTWLRAFIHNYLRPSEQPYDINQLLDLTTGESSALRYARYDPRPASQFSEQDVQALRPQVHRDLAGADRELVFVKTHNALVKFHNIELITPEVTDGAIYVVRDPRDVAISFSHHLGIELDEMIALMANPQTTIRGDDHKVFEHISSWSAHVHLWTRQTHHRLLVLRYEDMLDKPHGTFQRVASYLEGKADQTKLANAIRHSSFTILSEQERRSGFVEKPGNAGSLFFRNGRPGQWKTILTAAQRARIEQAHGGMMRQFRYL
jgi:hypothetical protein